MKSLSWVTDIVETTEFPVAVVVVIVAFSLSMGRWAVEEALAHLAKKIGMM